MKDVVNTFVSSYAGNRVHPWVTDVWIILLREKIMTLPILLHCQLYLRRKRVILMSAVGQNGTSGKRGRAHFIIPLVRVREEAIGCIRELKVTS